MRQNHYCILVSSASHLILEYSEYSYAQITIAIFHTVFFCGIPILLGDATESP